MKESISRLKEIDREVSLLAHTGAILGWDQETYMPEKAIEERSEQFALLSAIRHEKATAPEIGELLDNLGADRANSAGVSDLAPLDRAFVRRVFRDYSRSTKLPKNLVVRLAQATSKGQAVWQAARRESDFSAFAPALKELLALTLEVSDALGWDDHPYDPLLDEYEPFMKTAEVASVFDKLRTDLVPLVEQIRDATPVDDSVVRRRFPVEGQSAFGRRVLEAMGWDFSRGRLDVSTHPFTTSLGRDDVRLTTRYQEDFFNTGIFGTIHEAGHGLYELGFGDKIRGTSLADGTSLGIHESQSRMWENLIGRSLPFWRHFYPKLRDIFPSQLNDIDVETFWKAVNAVKPSFIRVEADEVTYSLHIILRFRLETELINKKLSVDDLPERWNSEMEDLLGIRPSSDAEGVLQDIHWSMGGIGYFPTYALGNLYASQFMVTMRRDIPSLDTDIEAGRLTGILEWLRKNVHIHGSAKTAGELVKDVTGAALDPTHFVRYLNDKFSGIYKF